jgi:hypothetical protein
MNETQWLRHLLPLPHEIAIEGVVECRPAQVGIRVAESAGELEIAAAAELRQLFAERGGAEPSENQEFTIFLGVVDSSDGRLDGVQVDVERLRDLPNSSQAYAILPEGRKRLLLYALNGKGVSYAARTLYQLLEPVLSPQKLTVTIPLLCVLDWPDIEERGLWNFPDPVEWIPWMASLKLNYGKMTSTDLVAVQKDAPGAASIDSARQEAARLRGFNYIPYIVHLNFLHDTGIFHVYPELAGKGDGALAGRYFAHKEGNQHRAPCASQPLLVQLIAEWMDSIATQGGLEISCWLSERPCQCECDTCLPVGQFVLETRAFLAAWRRARERHPELAIRIFSSTTTTQSDHRILAELPPEVKFERACATGMERVPHLPRDLLANPLLDGCAAEGRWIASYDVPLGVYGRVDTPEFKLPHHSAHRIRDFVGQLIRRRYSGAYGMMAWATQGKQTCGFNICALAEWSWNLGGRNERDFALAWATREGYENPEAVADWAELVGPVEFDVYDSDFPVCYSWGQAADLVIERRRPRLGEGMFRYYLDPEDFARKRRVCEQALEISAGFGDDQNLARSTAVLLSYVELCRCVYEVADLFATCTLTSLEDQGSLRALLEELARAGESNVAAIRSWRAGLGPEPWHHRVHDAIAATEDTVNAIQNHISERYFY